MLIKCSDRMTIIFEHIIGFTISQKAYYNEESKITEYKKKLEYYSYGGSAEICNGSFEKCRAVLDYIESCYIKDYKFCDLTNIISEMEKSESNE